MQQPDLPGFPQPNDPEMAVLHVASRFLSKNNSKDLKLLLIKPCTMSSFGSLLEPELVPNFLEKTDLPGVSPCSQVGALHASLRQVFTPYRAPKMVVNHSGG